MKKGIRKIPLVGIACEYAHHIFVDKSGPSKIRASYDSAREVLKEGMSLVVFPEGARTLYRSHGCVPPRCLHACRRIAVAGLSAYHQWQFRCQASHEGYLLGILASAEAHHP